jgi:hypothetical protein
MKESGLIGKNYRRTGELAQNDWMASRPQMERLTTELGQGGAISGFPDGDLERERGRDRDPERVERGCDRQPEDERGGAETGRRSVTSAGDRATAVTGIRRRTRRPPRYSE